MDARPEPLPVGTLVGERFRITEVLGRGGFGIAYLTDDTQRGDRAVIKELAPRGATRREDGWLDLSALPEDETYRTRMRFLEEARMLSRLNLTGVPAVRASISERGTAYVATEAIDGAITLADLLQREGRLSQTATLDILFPLMEVLEAIHSRGILHRDLKPSNVLLGPKGEVVLIDFGAAREFARDTTVEHTAFHTPGYAPPEQLESKGRRGPASDIYALCATAYHMLTGAPPPDASSRAAGAELRTIRSIAPEVDSQVASALEKGLGMRAVERPQEVQELRADLALKSDDIGSTRLAEVDGKLADLKAFTYDSHACPACGGVLHRPRPLAKHVCPVCWQGRIKRHAIQRRLCPLCEAGTLKEFRNSSPLRTCPACGGFLRYRWQGPKRGTLDCKECGARFARHGSQVRALDSGQEQSEAEWRQLAGRTERLQRCDGCAAQWDVLANGEWEQKKPSPKGRAIREPIEWARMAARLDPLGGEAECTACGADYAIVRDRVSLLKAANDPFGFAARHANRLLTWDDIRWLGVGKESPASGFVCKDCGTELDESQGGLRLVRTDQRLLITQTDTIRSLKEWHRIGRGLPTPDEEAAFLDLVEATVRQAYRDGEVPFDRSGRHLWKGSGRLIPDGGLATLLADDQQVTIGGLIRKHRIAIANLVGAEADGEILMLWSEGSRSPTEIEVEEVLIRPVLTSGTIEITLRAGDLAHRILSVIGCR